MRKRAKRETRATTPTVRSSEFNRYRHRSVVPNGLPCHIWYCSQPLRLKRADRRTKTFASIPPKTDSVSNAESGTDCIPSSEFVCERSTAQEARNDVITQPERLWTHEKKNSA